MALTYEEKNDKLINRSLCALPNRLPLQVNTKDILLREFNVTRGLHGAKRGRYMDRAAGGMTACDGTESGRRPRAGSSLKDPQFVDWKGAP